MSQLFSGRRSNSESVVLSRLPQVNLLPPEISISRAVARVKFLLLLVILAIIGVVALVFLWASGQEADAQTRLSEAQSRTVELRAEKAMYSEVIVVKGDLDYIQNSALIATSTDIAWYDLIDALAAVTPEEASFDTIQIATSTPFSEVSVQPDALQEHPFAVLSFTGRALQTTDVTAWITELEKVPGVSHVDLRSQTLSGNEEWAGEYFAINGEIKLSEEAVHSRMAEKLGGDQ